jgi:hypothetical protein
MELGVIRRGGESRWYRNGRVKRGVNGVITDEHMMSIVSGRISERETKDVKIA